jgi:hypothetical protein
MITTPGGRIASNQICRDVPIQMGSTLIRTALISLNLEGMDILLGMDWMTRHRVSLDIFSRIVEINPRNMDIPSFIFHSRNMSALVYMP